MKIIIEIQEEHVAQFGAILIHGFDLDYEGNVTGITEISAPCFEASGEPEDGSDVIYGYVQGVGKPQRKRRKKR